MHFKKSRLGYLWELIDPMMQIMLWFALIIFIGGSRTIYDMNTFLFLSTGIIGMFFFQKVAQQLPGGSRRQTNFARLPVVRQIDTVLAAGLSEIVVMTLVAVIVWGGIILGGWGFAPADPLGVIASCASLGALGLCFGWFNATVLVFAPAYQQVTTVIFRVLFYVSGALFPLERIPPSLFFYLQWNPVYQGLDLLRSAWSYTHYTTTSTYGYVWGWAACFTLAGLALDKHVFRRRSAQVA